MKVELTKDWCMNMAQIEARAEELHEGCRMPMEQARELAASEANPDWYARGQDWGLADALTAGQDGDWTLDDIARAFAAGAQAGATVAGHGFGKGVGPIAELVACLRDNSGRHINGLYDKRAADELERLAELADSEGSRAVNYLRRARKVEAEVALLRAALNEATTRELHAAQEADELRAALRELVALADMKARLENLHAMGHGTDWDIYHKRHPAAWATARLLALGPNAKAHRLP